MELNRVYSKVFGWMFIGLLLTFLTGYTVANNLNMLLFVYEGNKWIIFSIIEIILVIFLSARIQKMSSITAKICFVIYSIVTGLTFSSIFLTYKLGSIIYVFGITALLFGIFALFGHFTKMDLGKISTYLFMGLLGIIICNIVNIFVGSETFDMTICIVGVIIFLGYTAYDVKKINYLSGAFENEDNLAIYGALELYLDFINLFLKLLRLFAKRDD